MTMAELRPVAAATAPTETPDGNPGPARRTITVVIPAFNEEDGIGPTLEAVKALMPATVTELIVVDDGSTDRTAEVAAAAGVRVLRHANNRGYGASLKTAIHAATGDYVLTMDADGQHRIEDVAKLCHQIAGPDAPECVIGQRVKKLHSPLWRMPGKWLLTRMAQFLIRRKIPDLNSGLRIIRRDVALRYMRICPQGFSFSTTITMALMSRGYDVRFVPIAVEKRVGKSTVTAGTGFQTILLVLRLATLFNPLRIFLPISAASVTVGVAWSVPYVMDRQGVTVGSMLAILTGVLLFALGLICDQVAQMRLERYE